VAGNRSEVELLWHAELATLASEHPRFRYEPVVSQPDATWCGRRGYVQEHLEEITAGLAPGFCAYLCGSHRMVNACRELLGTLGVAGERIFYEAYA
jgi:NAD(P)H-flavin reductase